MLSFTIKRNIENHRENSFHISFRILSFFTHFDFNSKHKNLKHSHFRFLFWVFGSWFCSSETLQFDCICPTKIKCSFCVSSKVRFLLHTVRFRFWVFPIYFRSAFSPNSTECVPSAECCFAVSVSTLRSAENGDSVSLRSPRDRTVSEFTSKTTAVVLSKCVLCLPHQSTVRKESHTPKTCWQFPGSRGNRWFCQKRISVRRLTVNWPISTFRFPFSISRFPFSTNRFLLSLCLVIFALAVHCFLVTLFSFHTNYVHLSECRNHSVCK